MAERPDCRRFGIPENLILAPSNLALPDEEMMSRLDLKDRMILYNQHMAYYRASMSTAYSQTESMQPSSTPSPPLPKRPFSVHVSTSGTPLASSKSNKRLRHTASMFFDCTKSMSIDIRQNNPATSSQSTALTPTETSTSLSNINAPQRSGSPALQYLALKSMRHPGDCYGCKTIFNADLHFRRWYDGKQSTRDLGERLNCQVVEKDEKNSVVFSRLSGCKEVAFEEPIRNDVSYEILRNYVFCALTTGPTEQQENRCILWTAKPQDEDVAVELRNALKECQADLLEGTLHDYWKR